MTSEAKSSPRSGSIHSWSFGQRSLTIFSSQIIVSLVVSAQPGQETHTARA